MGKNKVRKRKILLKQFVISYFMVMICSIITAAILITVFYLIFHHFNGYDGLDTNNQNLTDIIKFVNEHGNSIDNRDIRKQMDELARRGSVDYYVTDKNNKVLYKTDIVDNNLHKQNSLISNISEIRHSFHNTSSIQIPLLDRNTGKITRILVLEYCSTINWLILSFVDAGIPFVCFLIYTYIFAVKLSGKIRLPLQELMSAAGKIKSRDLDFKINCTLQDNEIGDLVEAFEEMRNELNDSLIKQWQLEQDRRDMVSAITHDIRTPLAIIQGHVEGLQDGIKNDPQKLNKYLEVVQRNVQRAKKLIDDMNTLVEIDNEAFSVYPMQVDLNEFLKNKTREMKVLANKKGINLQMDIKDSRTEKTPSSIDSGRLSQMIDNIVSNSIRFTSEGGNITISADIIPGKATFKICDTGTGFSEKDTTNLFRKFYKGDYSRSVEKGHSGLGLYIAKSIVEKHGGTIQAYNLKEKGACVEFWIEI